MGLPSDQQITQLKTSTSRVPTWKKKVKKVFQLRDAISGWKVTEYPLEKGAIKVLSKIFDVVICSKRRYRLLIAIEKCIRSMKK